MNLSVDTPGLLHSTTDSRVEFKTLPPKVKGSLGRTLCTQEVKLETHPISAKTTLNAKECLHSRLIAPHPQSRLAQWQLLQLPGEEHFG